MRRHRTLHRAAWALTAVLGGGTILGNGCMNTVASLPLCGTLLTWCTPMDQLNLFYPLLQTPDFQTDPSCTIPLGCHGSDIYDQWRNNSGTPNAQSPGGGSSEEPTAPTTTGGGG